jgi:membrane protein DedA with SNARE-associated domain
MTVSALVAQYGYAFVFAGALTEGESVLLAAGFAAHRGMLELDRVIAVAFVAGTLGDQFYFYLGRRHGQRLLARWPALQARAQRVRPLLERHPNAAIFSLRFLYGLRTAGPIALGMLGVSARRFAEPAQRGPVVAGFLPAGLQFGQVLQLLPPYTQSGRPCWSAC